MPRAGAKIATGSEIFGILLFPRVPGDILEIARWTLLAGHLHASELPVAFAWSPTPPLSSWDFADYGLRPGARADMVIADSEDAVRLVAGGPDHMIVVSKGRPIGANAAAH